VEPHESVGTRIATSPAFESGRTVALFLSVLYRRSQLRRHDSWHSDRLKYHQSRQLARLRDYAYIRSPFYSRFHAGLQQTPLSELPVLTKSVLMENFDDIVTARDVRLGEVDEYLAALSGNELFRGRYYVSATAGTTGRRGIFLWNFTEWVQVIASYNRAFDWAGSTAGLTHQVRTAVVSSTNPTHQSARVGASIHSRWVPTLRIDSGEQLPEIVARLNLWQPEMLIGYASMLRLLAEEQLSGRLAIAPKFLFSASEVLTPSTRHLTDMAWGQPLYNVYGATETSGIAAECGEHTGMHLFEDLVITEVVDEDFRPVPAGTYGAKVLVTVLFSRTLPLIRYEMTDSVQLAGEHDCACGRPYATIKGVQGRQQEALGFLRPDGGLQTVQPIVFHDVMDRVDAGGWQIVQRADRIEVLLAQPEHVNFQELAASIRAALSSLGIAPPEIQIREVDAIPRTPLGKAPLITRAE
jgi:putative adenylate-forming enzyme